MFGEPRLVLLNNSMFSYYINNIIYIDPLNFLVTVYLSINNQYKQWEFGFLWFKLKDLVKLPYNLFDYRLK